MDLPDLIATARLERERAQKAQFTAMMMRDWALRARARYRLLRARQVPAEDLAPLSDLAL